LIKTHLSFSLGRYQEQQDLIVPTVCLLLLPVVQLVNMAPTRSRRKVASIPLTPPKDAEIEYVKHCRSEVINGVTEEIQEKIPKLSDDASANTTLRFFAAITQVRTHMQWTTEPKLFQRFSLHLQGVNLTTWEAQVQNVNQTACSSLMQPKNRTLLLNPLINSTEAMELRELDGHFFYCLIRLENPCERLI
jgi:hypothetical protein